MLIWVLGLACAIIVAAVASSLYEYIDDSNWNIFVKLLLKSIVWILSFSIIAVLAFIAAMFDNSKNDK